MTRKSVLFSLAVLFLSALICSSFADTFTHKETGDTFTGFKRQKSMRGLTLVYNAEADSFKPIDLDEYDWKMDRNGRRNRISVFQINEPEIMLSQVICEQIAEEIVKKADLGPLFILIEIDSPGGKGDYMRMICEAVNNTDTCPIYAYISGEKYGGAYSTAAAVALSCDRIYINSTASIGSVSPLVRTEINAENIEEHKSVFSPDTLVMHKSYIVSLAEQKNRSKAIAGALFDRTIEIVQVKDQNGKVTFVEKDNRTPTQVVVRSVSKNVSELAVNEEEDESKKPEFLISLTPQEAVEAKMADEIADSMQEVIKDLEADGAKPTIGINVSRDIRRYNANRRNMQRLIASVEYLESRAEQLGEQIQLAEKQNIVNQNEVTTEYYERDERRRMGYFGDDDYRFSLARRDNRISEFVTETRELDVDVEVLYGNLEGVLADLMADLRASLNLARRYPGALPEGVTQNKLESDLHIAEATYNDLIRR